MSLEKAKLTEKWTARYWLESMTTPMKGVEGPSHDRQLR